MGELYDIIQNLFFEFLHLLSFFFTVLSIGTICFGFIKSIFLLFTVNPKITLEKAIKIGMEKYILVGLQFLIVADIIDTIILRDLKNIVLVLLIVIIRTIMSWEIEKNK